MDDQDNVLVQAYEGASPERLRWAVRSFVMANIALAGLFLSQLVPVLVFFYLAFPGAIVFGHLAKRDLRREPERYTGFAMAQYGLMVGYFCMMITILVVVALFRGYQIGG
ncbi:MAG: DUF4190 domain-containing protein [Candidatus Hydrogenedentota bacterium]